MPGSFETEAVVLRSIRYGEADRILHLYTEKRGRVGAMAKGVRRVKTRFGGGVAKGRPGVQAALGRAARAAVPGQPDPARGARRPVHGHLGRDGRSPRP